jgi:hypothetical protein
MGCPPYILAYLTWDGKCGVEVTGADYGIFHSRGLASTSVVVKRHVEGIVEGRMSY